MADHPIEISLDPKNWDEFRALAHRALDDAITYVSSVSSRPVWLPVPPDARDALAQPSPIEEMPLGEVYEEFKHYIVPYATGNIHPRFFGWVHGAGQAGGMVAEMLAASMNANCGGRDHGAIYVERQVIDWCRGWFGFPSEASGLLVSGTSMANLIALGVARNTLPEVRRKGIETAGLTAYASTEVHESVTRAMEILGLGSESVRKVPVDRWFAMDTAALSGAIAADRAAGRQPLCVVGSAGTVNTGAIDPLDEIASICQDENLWFHVDGAFGALAVLSPLLKPRLRGIERADSIALDFHKWAQVQYDVGCVLVRRGELHRATYSQRPAYLTHLQRGLAAGSDWPCEFGPELSRGFRALKVWFALKEHGTRNIGRIVEQNCGQARYLAERVALEVELELLAPVTLNIVCFRYRPSRLAMKERDIDGINEEITILLQERGIAAPSTTRVENRLAIRVNITNHRTKLSDMDILLAGVLEIGRSLTGGVAPVRA
jgi:aromatic-L-amino-acid/L-tryptophan decarboxylase